MPEMPREFLDILLFAGALGLIRPRLGFAVLVLGTVVRLMMP